MMKNAQLLLVLILTMGTTISLFSQTNDKVFYSSFRPQGWDIHLSIDGGNTFSAFTTNESLDYDAKISPDGAWVVFTSERIGTPNLFVKSTTGTSLPRLLVRSNSMQDQVSFSPDGKSIVFVSTHEGNADIYKLPFSPLDTLNIGEAINLSNNEAGDFRPSFSHDGNTIAFSSDRDHSVKPHRFYPFAIQRTGDVYTMASDGSNQARLTNSTGWDGSPVWSPDDAEIYFYSDRNPTSSIFKMDRDGRNQEVVYAGRTDFFSPALVNENTLLFTNLDGNPKSFSILSLDVKSQSIDSFMVQDMDMFNVDVHPSGIVVYHGGKSPVEEESNLGGFDGDILVKNNPETRDLDGQSLDLMGVRRAFAAPPSLEGTQLVYDFLPARGISNLMTPYIYPLLLLPLFALIWFIVGVVNSIRKRKIISFWKYLLFSIATLAITAFFVIQIYNKFVSFAMPLNKIRSFALIFMAILVVLAIVSRHYYKKHNLVQKSSTTLFMHYYWMFGSLAAVIGYLAIFCQSFFDVRPDFFTVDYKTDEVKHLFKFTPDRNLNPQLVRIIDTKFTPDGKYLQFTVGGFRSKANEQGAVYRYDLKNEKVEQLTELDNNDGFADFSYDNKSMVFRSGKTGVMDIYLKEDGELKNLTNSPAKENFPVIAPDGSMIAYCSDVVGKDIDGKVITMDIFVLTRLADNTWSEPKQITTYEGQEGHPHFSPDGKWLIFTSEEFGINDEQPLVQPYIFSPQMYGEITAIRIDDGEKVRLTHNKWEDGAPLWISGE